MLFWPEYKQIKVIVVDLTIIKRCDLFIDLHVLTARPKCHLDGLAFVGRHCIHLSM